MTHLSDLDISTLEPDQLPMGELATSMGITLTEISAERLVATMPVAGNRQPFGLLHCGANAVLAESIGSIHAAITARPGHIPVGVELSCTHHRGVREGIVTAVSTPIHVGGTISTFSVTITDSQGRTTCTARLTCLSRSLADAPEAASQSH